MPRKQPLKDQYFEQTEILKNGYAFLLRRGHDPNSKFMQQLKQDSVEGACFGFSIVGGIAEIQSHFVISKENDTQLENRDPAELFFQHTSRLFAWPTEYLTQLLPENEQQDIEHLLQQVIFFQNPERSLSLLSQHTVPQNWEYLQGENPITLEYSLGGEFTKDHLKEILPQIVHEGRLIMVGSAKHATNLMRIGNQYCFFNPNPPGKQIFEDSKEGREALINTIFSAHNATTANAVEIGFQSFYFNDENFDPAFKEKPHYPDQSAILTNHSTGNGLYVAAQIGCIKSVEQLLTTQEDLNLGKSNEGKSAFWIACQNGNLEVVKKLLENDKIEFNSSDKALLSPLGIACVDSRLEVVKLLLAHPKINVDNEYDLIDIACHNGHAELVKILLANNKIKMGDASLLLSAACTGGHAAVVKVLLENDKTNIQPIDVLTQLARACDQNQLEIVNVLLHSDKLDVKDQGSLFLYKAWDKGQWEILKSLLASDKIHITGKNSGEEGMLLLYYICNTAPKEIINEALQNDKFASAHAEIEKFPKVKMYFNNYLKSYIGNFINTYYHADHKESAIKKLNAETDYQVLVMLLKSVSKIEKIIDSNPDEKNKSFSEMSPAIKIELKEAVVKIAENLSQQAEKYPQADKILHIHFTDKNENLLSNTFGGTNDNFIIYKSSVSLNEKKAEAFFQDKMSIKEAYQLFIDSNQRFKPGSAAFYAKEFLSMVKDTHEQLPAKEIANLTFSDFIKTGFSSEAIPQKSLEIFLNTADPVLQPLVTNLAAIKEANQINLLTEEKKQNPMANISFS
jgi:ankyrin repeat protein